MVYELREREHKKIAEDAHISASSSNVHKILQVFNVLN